MDREDNYDIPTPDTSRSNSINEEEEEEDKSVEPTPAVPVEDTTQAESSRSRMQNKMLIYIRIVNVYDLDDQSTDVTQPTRPAKRATFVPSSSSSESENDFVAVERNDADDDASAITNPVSCFSLIEYDCLTS
ncbi:unnamed protein product [Adineta ricciae]|uniref:Uncharacterized protein n=1 Tax=Adineta ricciae TaxID=249248 RepID=A0A815EQ44_ADIRI|nr:unnamed protein product [Adineta ricciae]